MFEAMIFQVKSEQWSFAGDKPCPDKGRDRLRAVRAEGSRDAMSRLSVEAFSLRYSGKNRFRHNRLISYCKWIVNIHIFRNQAPYHWL